MAKRFHNLVRAEGLSAGLWDCRADHPRAGREELTTLPTLNVPLSGSYTRHGRQGVQVVDVLTASLSNAGDAWRTSHPGSCGDRGVYVQLSPERAATLLPSRTDAGPEAPFSCTFLPVSAAGWLRWRTLVADLAARALSGVAAVDAVEHALEGLVPGAPLPAHATELAREARAALATRPWSIPELADELGVSAGHLCRAFRRATGTTVHGWQEAVRLRAAADRLADHPEDLASLAFELGFSSHAHFTTRFRRHFGRPPSALRAASPGG